MHGEGSNGIFIIQNQTFVSYVHERRTTKPDEVFAWCNLWCLIIMPCQCLRTSHLLFYDSSCCCHMFHWENGVVGGVKTLEKFIHQTGLKSIGRVIWKFVWSDPMHGGSMN
jgi:hypothetical protein